ncbi:MAG: septum formation initiator family protein [Deltaproteobacteria bacterium]|nr:septum formation initiator family protein [Deltaproteobacteria bacterium]
MVITVFFTVFGKRGLIKIYRLRQELKRSISKADFFQYENTRLSEYVDKLKKEKVFQEHYARETLGWVQDDEIIYEFSDE